MINLTRINGKEFFLNVSLIETLEANLDTTTIISTTVGKKYNVKETTDEIISKVIEFKRKIYITYTK